MTVTGATGSGGLGIGELAALTGVPVRTIRFYCDEGILEPARSAGGHRRFDGAAADRLRLVRRLRGLGLGLPAIAAVLAGERSLGEAVAAERAALEAEMSALAWRRAALTAVESAAPDERAARLELLAAAEDGRAARGALVDFWLRRIMAPLPEERVEAFLEMVVPPPPADPSPVQVVAYAEMVVLAGDRSLNRRLLAQGRSNVRVVGDEESLLAGMSEAMELASPLVAAGEAPGPCRALDRFVAAHVAGRKARDGPEFRRTILRDAQVERDPRVARYWELFRLVTGEPVTLGRLHLWLLEALERSVPQARRRPE
ncbi:MerR family transcriptional regulator [Actinomadura opuntiae]|uniref:MerR family transcriptional regulator n=1 Tax=Actinomadura sp. OS1-43 TaxID=604315 RepID=UPI00255B3EFD|nr:MerR family transcriptional regulator [Actinomadura sp. OS1-43]MDL4817533.1 MerR family transcriptional regulator [Actinomadura sp. OS1-43]